MVPSARLKGVLHCVWSAERSMRFCQHTLLVSVLSSKLDLVVVLPCSMC